MFESVSVCAGSRKTCGGAAGWLGCTSSNYGSGYQVNETSCDGLDNDCDGQIDDNYNIGVNCLTQEGPCGIGEEECSGVSSPPTYCSTEFGGSAFDGDVLSCGESVSSTTAERPNRDSSYNCDNGVLWLAGERVFAFRAVNNNLIRITVTNMENDVDLLVLEDTCLGASCIYDSQNVRQLNEVIMFSGVSQKLYYFVIDSKTTSGAGAFTIKVECI